jgi:CheY-like chemotaxis protein
MDSDVQSHLFEPFFTTKERGRGTGLGLATVFGIVKQNEGHIQVDSQVGRGANFHVYLPRAQDLKAQASSHSPLSDAMRLAQGTETILLVEDEASVRELTVHILRMQGYHVLVAEQGAEALEVSRQHGGAIHLLLTDVIMPQMNGRELAERLLAERPETRVLYMSGYTGEVIARHGVLEPGTAFVAKPLTLERLTEMVRAVLDGRV